MANHSFPIEAVLSVKDQNFASGFQKAAEEARRFGDNLTQTRAKTETFTSILKGNGGITGATKEVATGFNEVVKNSADLSKSVNKTVEDTKNLSESLKGQGGAAGATKEAAKGLDQAAKEAQKFGSNIEQSKTKTKSFKDTVKGMATAIGITKAVAVGFNLIKNSVGAAMDRLDTMDNFRRSMKLMTGDSDAAQAALDRLLRASKGTAYGLDTMAKATQGFVTSAYDINLATEYVEGWGNAIATFGDGSNATMERVMLQMQQMAAKGKANMGDLKSAMEAGIPVLDIYASAVGKSVGEVSDQMSQGQISSRDFFDAMNRAFKYGTKEFPSLANAAKNAGKTWSATFANMRAAVTRGTVKVIESFEHTRRAVNAPGLKDGVQKLGQTIEKGMAMAAKAVEIGVKAWAKYGDAVKSVAAGAASYKIFETGLSSIAQYVNRLKDAHGALNIYGRAIQDAGKAEAIAAAAKKLNIALDEKNVTLLATGAALSKKQAAAIMLESGALTAKEAIMLALSGKLKIATAAQYAFNTAVAANPIGAIAVGIGVVVGALVGLNKILSRTTKEFDEAQDKAKEFADKTSSVINQAKDLNDEFKRSEARIKGNAKQAESLIGAIERIGDSSATAATKKKRLVGLVDQLKQLYPDLKIEIDKTGEAIVGGTDKIKEQIEAFGQLERVKVFEKLREETYVAKEQLAVYIEQTKELMAEMEAAGTHQKMNWWTGRYEDSEGYAVLKERLGQLTEQFDAATFASEKYEQQLESSLIQEERAREALEAAQNSLAMLREQYGLTTEEIKNYTARTGESLDEAGSKVKELAGKYTESADEIIAAVQNQGITLEEWDAKQQEILQNATKAYQDFVSTTTDGFHELSQNSAISLDEYQANMEANIEATRNWADNVATLMEAGVDAGIIEHLKRMGPAGAEQAAAFVAELEELNGGALGKFDELSAGAQEKIIALAETLETGMETAADAAKLEIQASDYIAMGKIPPEEIAEGIRAEKVQLEQAASEAISPMLEALKTKAKDPQLQTVGGDMMRTVIGGTEEALSSFSMSKIDDEVKRSMTDSTSHVRTGMQQIAQVAGDGSGQIAESYSGLSKNVQKETKSMANESTRNIERGIRASNRAMTQGAGEMTRTATQTNSDVTGAMSSLGSNLHEVGYQAGIGLNNGLNAAAPTIYSTANTIANNVAQTMRNALQVKSPSRITRAIGGFVGKGLSLGLMDMKDDVMRAADKLANAAIPNPGQDFALSDDFGRVTSQGRGSTAQAQPATLLLQFGAKTFRAFVDDITAAQGKKLELEEVYGV